MKDKPFPYWLVVFGVTWGQIVLVSSAIREPTAHNLTLMLAIQASGLYTLILYSLRGIWMPWLAKQPLRNACWLGIFDAVLIETLFWGIQKVLGATDVAAHPNLLIDLVLTMPWYAGMVVLFVRFQQRRNFSPAVVLLMGALYEVGADGLVGGQIIPLINGKPVDFVGSWGLLAALAFWQFIPVYSSMVLPPAWVLEGASTRPRQPGKGGSGWRAWLDALAPLIWLAPYTIYVIIIMVIMGGGYRLDGNIYSIDVKVKADPDEARAINDGLKGFNNQFSEDDNHQELAIVLRDAQGRLAGGLLGDTFWRWLHINTLWIREDVRSLGYGSRLMVSAEQEAIRRGCRHSHLETHDFQALGFYQKKGYTLFAQLDDLPPGHIKYFLKKDL